MENIFIKIYELLNSLLFAAEAVIGDGSYFDMILTVVSTCACLFIISVPFIIVYKVIQLVVGR